MFGWVLFDVSELPEEEEQTPCYIYLKTMLIMRRKFYGAKTILEKEKMFCGGKRIDRE